MRHTTVIYPIGIAALLLLCLSEGAARSEEVRLGIFATYNNVETVAGSFSYDPADLLGNPFGQDYFALSGFTFTSPATGRTWNLSQIERMNGPAGYAPNFSSVPYVLDRVFGEVMLLEDGTANGLGAVTFGFRSQNRWESIWLSPFGEYPTIGRYWHEYFGIEDGPSGTYRIVPEPKSASLLFSLFACVVCGLRTGRANRAELVLQSRGAGHGRDRERRGVICLTSHSQ